VSVDTQDKHRIIDAVQAPTDLHALDDDELRIVAQELRAQIVESASRTGGHVASSLGAVDIIVALHAELDCPHDKIVYDVGHQAYAHKLLTGRLADFDTLRQEGGVSGFPNPDESPYDVHYSGHASDALSVALGLAKARDLAGGDERIVALIGDASISGGMAFEALNQIGQIRANMVIVLNDNKMSISPVVGGLARHFGEIRSTNEYREGRDFIKAQMANGGNLSRAALAFGHSAKSSAKHFFLPDTTLVYEQLGITCMAPVDGHDIAALRRVLRTALSVDGPALVHVVTRKGKGYEPAERQPELFHGVGPFNVRTGEVAPRSAGYSGVMGKQLVCEARADERIVAITAAMKEGTGLTAFADEFPERFFDVGICEEHALGLAGGLAKGGAKPVVAIYSTFLQRAIDQLIVNVALPRLDVVLCIDRAGIVGGDGVTHQGAYDLVYTRMVPGLRMLAPSDATELVDALHTALALDGPVAIRYPRGGSDVAPAYEPQLWKPGKARCLRVGDDVALLAWGSLVGQALLAAELLAAQGVEARVMDMRWAKPLDEGALCAAADTRLMVTLEEGVLCGGVGEEALAVLARHGLCVPALNLGLPDEPVPHGDPAHILHELGLDAEGIAAAVLARL